MHGIIASNPRGGFAKLLILVLPEPDLEISFSPLNKTENMGISQVKYKGDN